MRFSTFADKAEHTTTLHHQATELLNSSHIEVAFHSGLVLCEAAPVFCMLHVPSVSKCLRQPHTLVNLSLDKTCMVLD